MVNGRQPKKQRRKNKTQTFSPHLASAPERELSSPAGRSGRKSVPRSWSHMRPECAKPLLHLIFHPNEVGSLLQPEDINPRFASFPSGVGGKKGERDMVMCKGMGMGEGLTGAGGVTGPISTGSSKCPESTLISKADGGSKPFPSHCVPVPP